MSVVPTTLVPADTVRDVAAFARTLVAAARTRQLYSADHPAAVAGADRLRAAFAQVASHAGLELGVAPTTLLANGELLPSDSRIGEAAALLHERDILRLRVRGAPATNEVFDFLQVLTFDANALRARGGPAPMWESFGYRWLEIDQLNYDEILRSAPAGAAPPAGSAGGNGSHRSETQDDVWTSLVRSMAGGRTTLETAAQKRLLDVARSAESIQALATQASAGQVGPGGEPLAAAQAATVLATFDRLVEVVRSSAPDDLGEAVGNVAKAAGQLDPALVMRAIGESAESGMGGELTATLGRYFDDNKIATMLARSLAAEGRASGRMAAALTTLAPEAGRRDRVLRLARSMHADSAGTSGLEAAWSSLQEFMSGPSDMTYVSDGYATALDQAEARSHRLLLDVPAELEDWVQSVSSESVRTLSVTLLLDLFGLEEQSVAITETANDLAALACDLLLAGDVAEALRIAKALREAGAARKSARALAARLALESIATSEAMSGMLPLVGDLDPAQFEEFVRLCTTLGPGVLRFVVAAYAESEREEGRSRLRDILAKFGDTATAEIGRLARSDDWALARAAIQLLGHSNAAEAIQLLQPLAKDSNLRRAREAIGALIRLDDPAAAKAVSRLMALGDRELRTVAIDALAASRDHRASPVIAGLLLQLDVLGGEHHMALHAIAALRVVGDDTAIESVVSVTRARRWFAGSRMHDLRHAALGVLLQIKTPAARHAIESLARGGDRRMRRLAREALRGAA